MIVVDASVAAKWLFAEEHSLLALALLDDTLNAGEPIFGPPLLPIEVTNIIRQRMRRESLLLDEAGEKPSEFLAVPIAVDAPEGLYAHALQIAETHNLASAYDAHYVALADQLGCTLWTHDERLLRALDGKLSFVRSIADYVPRGITDVEE